MDFEAKCIDVYKKGVRGSHHKQKTVYVFEVTSPSKRKGEKFEKVLFIITTDGYENASHEFNKEQIKEMIQGHKDWEFMYIGADIDSYSEGQSIGIDSSNIANYKKDKRGISKFFKAMGRASSCFCEDACVGSSWKEELKEYIEENKTNETIEW